jgi:hypothetical protein
MRVAAASRIEQRTPEWKQMYNKRAGIEGTFSQGVRSFGLRRSRYRTTEDTLAECRHCMRNQSAAVDRLLERDTACLDTHIRLRSTPTMGHVIDFANSIPFGPRMRRSATPPSTPRRRPLPPLQPSARRSNPAAAWYPQTFFMNGRRSTRKPNSHSPLA